MNIPHFTIYMFFAYHIDIVSKNWYSGVRMRKPAKTFEDLLVWQKAHLLQEVSKLLETYSLAILNSDS